jgi:type VI secretion system secreted protein Hcp
MPIYMNYEGIKGQVTNAAFKDQVRLTSFQLGTGRSVGDSSGHSASRETSAPHISEVNVTKDQDSASVELFKASLFGEGKKCVITFTKTSADGKAEQTYFVITLENTLVSSFNMSGGADAASKISEGFSLNFTKLEVKYLETDEKNKAAKPQIATWNLATGTSS